MTALELLYIACAGGALLFFAAGAATMALRRRPLAEVAVPDAVPREHVTPVETYELDMLRARADRAELERLRTQIALGGDLEGKLEEAMSQLAHHHRMAIAFEDRSKQLGAELEHARTAAAAATNRATHLTMELERAWSTASKATGDAARQRVQAEAARRRPDETRVATDRAAELAELERSRLALATATAELERQRQRVTELETQLDRARTAVVPHEDRQLVADLERARIVAANATHRATQLAAELAIAKQRAAQLEIELDRATVRSPAKDAELARSEALAATQHATQLAAEAADAKRRAGLLATEVADAKARASQLAAELERARTATTAATEEASSAEARAREAERQVVERTVTIRDLAAKAEMLEGRVRDGEALRAEYVRLRTASSETAFLKSEVARLEERVRTLQHAALVAPPRRQPRASSGLIPRAETIGDSLTAALERFADPATRSLAVSDTLGFPLASSGGDGSALAAYAALLVEAANRAAELLPMAKPTTIELIDDLGARVAVWTFEVERERMLLVDLAVAAPDPSRVETALADLAAILTPREQAS